MTAERTPARECGPDFSVLVTKIMNLRHISPWLLSSLVATAAAGGCSADPGTGVDGNADSNTDSADGLSVDGNSSDGLSVDDGGSGAGTPSDGRDLPVREKVCDANGQNCTCLRLALLGTLDSAANNKDTQPFIDWLNGNSDGTATVTMVDTKPTLDAAFLAQYDILLVANVNSWTFSADEKAAVETWVRQTGGGIIALTGFVSTEAEATATSQLIEFSGVKFTAPKSAENGQSKPVTYQGGSTDLKNCLAWSGSSDAIITTPIQFTPQTGGMEKLTLALDYVGAFIGWGVVAPTDATVVATDPVSSQPMAVAKEIDGTGRVFAFGDEWVVFKNQWEPVGNPGNTQPDEYNICWIPPAEGETEGSFHSVQTLYQTKQFWFNAINWVAPPNECGFTVTDPDVVTVK